MTRQTLDLTSELLRGMRLSGVNYRRIETGRPFGVAFNSVPGKPSSTSSVADKRCCGWPAASG
jgi:hypothetical protein